MDKNEYTMKGTATVVARTGDAGSRSTRRSALRESRAQRIDYAVGGCPEPAGAARSL